MNGTGALTRRIRTAALVVLVGLGVTATGPAASAADGVQPPPVPLLPGVTGHPTVVVDDDAIFVQVFNPNTDPAIYRRSMTTSPSGITLGPPELVGRGAMDGSIAAHDGTLAYARAIDGRLVLRAPDGTETVAAWDEPYFARGIGDLTATWAVATTLGSGPRLFNLVTGTELDVRALTPSPGGSQLWGVQDIEVTEDRMLWSVHGSGPGQYWGVFTVAMGADGPTGPVVTLEEHSCVAADPCAGAVLWGLDLVGDAAAWLNTVSADVLAVRAFAGPPYAGEPGEVLVDPMDVVGFTGTQVVTQLRTDDLTRLDWWDPLAPDPAVPVRSMWTVSGAWSVDGTTLVGTRGAAPELLVQDATLPVTADPSPAPRLPQFSDVGFAEYTNAAFRGEILWLADHGIVGGFPDGTFRGLASVHRDAMAAFLYRVAHDGADAPACTAAAFADVPASHPFCGEVTWLASTGITTGFADGTFRPGAPVTREAMAAFLYRFAHDGADAPACTTAPFGDVLAGQRFCGEVAWLADTGVSTGWPDHTFRPALSIERQAMAAFLFRFIDAGLVPAG